jgi:hypothetical protein
MHSQETTNCPICKKQIRADLRYRFYVCGDCADKTTSPDGRALIFYNENLSGGCVGQYVDTGEVYASNECYIEGVKCIAEEARFGGIVIEIAVKNYNFDIKKVRAKSWRKFSN